MLSQSHVVFTCATPSDATALVSGTAVEELYLGVRETTLSALSAIFHSRTIKELRLNISSLSKVRNDVL